MNKTELKELLNDSFWIMPATPKFIDSGVPYITSKNIKKGEIAFDNAKFISEVDYEKISKKRPIIANDILVSMIGTLGATAIVQSLYGEFYGQNVYLLRLNSNVLNHEFFIFFMNSFIAKRHLEGKMNQSTQKYLKADHVESLMIPNYTIDEQDEISKILGTLSGIIDKRKEQLEEFDYLIKSRFVEMFGDPVLNDKEWSLVTVIDECDCMVPGRDKPKSFTGNIPWIRIDDLVVNGRTLTSNRGLGLTKEEISSVKRKSVPKGSVIMSCVGNLGICSIADTDLIINQQLHSFQCGDNVSNYYLMHYLGYRVDYMNKFASSTTVLYMNKSVCNSIPLMLPPLELQQQFSCFVQHVDKLKVEVQKSLDETQILFDSLMQKYFE